MDPILPPPPPKKTQGGALPPPPPKPPAQQAMTAPPDGGVSAGPAPTEPGWRPPASWQPFDPSAGDSSRGTGDIFKDAQAKAAAGGSDYMKATPKRDELWGVKYDKPPVFAGGDGGWVRQPDGTLKDARDVRIDEDWEALRGDRKPQYEPGREAAMRDAGTWTSADEFRKQQQRLVFQRDVLKWRKEQLDSRLNAMRNEGWMQREQQLAEDELRIRTAMEKGEPIDPAQMQKFRQDLQAYQQVMKPLLDEQKDIQDGFEYTYQRDQEDRRAFENSPEVKDQKARQAIVDQKYQDIDKRLKRGDLHWYSPEVIEAKVVQPTTSMTTKFLFDAAGALGRTLDQYGNIPNKLTGQEEYYSPFAEAADNLTRNVEYLTTPSEWNEPIIQKDWSINTNSLVPKLMQAATYMTLLGASGARGGNAGLTAAAYASQEEDYYREAIASGMTPGQAQAFSIPAAAAQALMERISPGPLMSGRTVKDVMMERTLKALKGGASPEGAIKDAFQYALTETSKEGLQEGVQGLADVASRNIANLALGDEKLDGSLSPQALAEQTLMGAAMGFLASAPGATKRLLQRPMTAQTMDWAARNSQKVKEFIEQNGGKDKAQLLERLQEVERLYDGNRLKEMPPEKATQVAPKIAEVQDIDAQIKQSPMDPVIEAAVGDPRVDRKEELTREILSDMGLSREEQEEALVRAKIIPPPVDAEGKPIKPKDEPRKAKPLSEEPTPQTDAIQVGQTVDLQNGQSDNISEGAQAQRAEPTKTAGNIAQEVPAGILSPTIWLDSVARGESQESADAKAKQAGQSMDEWIEGVGSAILDNPDGSGAALRASGDNGENTGSQPIADGARPPQEQKPAGQQPGESLPADPLSALPPPRTGEEGAPEEGNTTRWMVDEISALRSMPDGPEKTRRARAVLGMLRETFKKEVDEGQLTQQTAETPPPQAGVPSGVLDQPPAPEQVKKTFATKRAYEGDLREETKREIEKLGLYREVESHEEAVAGADAIIQQAGLDTALEAVRQGDIRGSASTVIRIRAQEALDEAILNATTQEEVDALAKQQAELIQETDRAQTEYGRATSILDYLYQNSDLGFKSEIKSNEWRKQFGEEPPKELLEKWRERDDEFRKLREQVREAEQRAKEAEEKATMTAIQDSVKRIRAKAPAQRTANSVAAKKLADRVRTLKIGNKGLSASIIPPVLFDGAVETVALSIEAGGKVADAVAKGVDMIRDSEWFKGLTDPEKRQAEREYAATFDSLLSTMVRDAVEAGAKDINSLVEQVQQGMPGYSEREVRDAITGYGRQSQSTRTDLQKEIDNLKRIGRKISKLEDVKARKEPAKSPKVREKLSEEEERLNQELKQAIKELNFNPLEQARRKEEATLEATKTRIQKRINDLRRRINEGDFSKPEKKNPVQDSEINRLNAEKLRLQNEYDKEFYREKLRQRTLGQRIGDGAWQAWNLARALKATMDLSFVLMQGGVLTTSNLWRNPGAVARAFKNMFNAMRSDKRSEEWLNRVKSQEWYPIAKKAGLGLTEPHAELTAREELFMSDWTNAAWRLLVLPAKALGKEAYEKWKAANPFQALERGAAAYLDTLRVERFADGLEILDQKKQLGEPVTEQDYKDVADVVNTLTGRASLGKAETLAPVLSKLFFSPRMWASQIKAFTPYAFWYLGKKSPTARKMALKDLSRWAGTTAGLVALAAVYLNNDDDDETSVEVDPASSDFGKIKLGTQRIDPWGGKLQQLRLTTQLIMAGFGEEAYKNINTGKKSKLGEGPFVPTAGDLMVRAATNKLAPAASMLWEAANTKVKKNGQRVTSYGQPYEPSKVLKEALIPIYAQSTYELLKDDPTALDGLLVLYTFLGVGLQDYKKEKK